MVAYDHEAGHSREVPEAWRRSLAAYENNEELLKNA
jgi:acyl-CoA thioesterase FadM